MSQNIKPGQLLEGLGILTIQSRTSSPQAQKFFDQGLALVFGFNHDEAVGPFARAAELDPKSPMPHWVLRSHSGRTRTCPQCRKEKNWHGKQSTEPSP